MRLENGGLHPNSCQQCHGVHLWHCNYSSISSEQRGDACISPLQLPQIPAFTQSGERSLLQGCLSVAVTALGKMKQKVCNKSKGT